MPLTHLHDPINGNDVPLEEAVAYFEDQGILPAEVIQKILNSANDPRRLDDHLSPSVANPSTTCRREQVIKRFKDYSLDPLVVWEAMEGTVWHEVFAKMTEGSEEWYCELPVPSPDDEDQENVKRTEEDVLVVEVFPGIWLSGVVDRINKDFSTLIDHKTQRFSKKDWGFKPDWKLQINLYALMLERTKGKKPEQLGVWRTYRGCYERDRTFRFFPCPPMTESTIHATIREHCESLQDYLTRARQAYKSGDEELLNKIVKEIPMDGKTMFNGKKCSQYCSVQKICFGLEGLPTF
jgi:hypothetical protein